MTSRCRALLQNEIDEESAKALVANGCKVVCEGANMPPTEASLPIRTMASMLHGSASAANARWRDVSGLEMSQNSYRFF